MNGHSTTFLDSINNNSVIRAVTTSNSNTSSGYDNYDMIHL